MDLYAGAGGVAVLLAEGVLEDALDGGGGVVVGVDGEVGAVVEGEGAQVVEAHDVVGVAVGVEDGVDAADIFAEGLGVEVGAGVDEDGVVVVGEADGGAGAPVARISVGDMAEVQTAQSQPSVGTPMEVPLPRKVRVACISYCLSDDAGAGAGRPVGLGWPALAAAERARAWVTSRKAMRSSKSAESSRRDSSVERLPLVFSARTASMSTLWRAPMRSSWAAGRVALRRRAA